MSNLLFILLVIVTLGVMMMKRASLITWFVVLSLFTLVYQSGIYLVSGETFRNGTFAIEIANRFTGYIENFGALGDIALWFPALAAAALAIPALRKSIFTGPVFSTIRRILPKVSETEQEALDAGTVGWDAELFSGKPDWQKLRQIPKINLTAEEQAFLEGPTEELCAMLKDWHIRQGLNDIPDEIWNFIREKGFFGMLISKEHGGLGFSAQAQSLIVGKVSACSPDVGVCVMVPNSLGPGELIEKFGTDTQKQNYLAALAKGEEVPCFALTGPTSGSDAANMRDVGIICHGEHNGRQTLGIRLSWEKRYISLGPKATLLGLAFRVFDPDNLIGDSKDIGITCALIPADHAGVKIGRRHQPAGCAFPNGPNWGEDVFIPLDWVIGGEQRVGQGWRMLMSCLAVGRAISLPASSAAATKQLLRVTSAYARIRKQFGIPIGRMEGVQERLARMVEAAYVTESGRAITASLVEAGAKPAVISALLKYQATEWMRTSVNDAMDIHGGRGVCDGPKNYLIGAYSALPVSITVEGANILTRSLIVFAQGALRSHPYLYDEIKAAQETDHQKGLKQFDSVFINHLGFLMSNIAGTLFHNLTRGIFASRPKDIANTAHWYRKLSAGSKNFALLADLTVCLLGGGLKQKQQITGRLADALSELYLMSCMLKRFEDDNAPQADRKVLDYAMQNALYRFEQALAGVIRNFPVKLMRPVLKTLIFPLGARAIPASDTKGQSIVDAVLQPGEMRDNLTRYLFRSRERHHPTGVLELTLEKTFEVEAIEKKLDKAIRKGEVKRHHGNDWFREAVEKQILSSQEAEMLKEYETLLQEAIAVDHFDPEEIRRQTAESHAQMAEEGRLNVA